MSTKLGEDQRKIFMTKLKFQLTNARQKISDVDYINDLRSVAKKLGKNSLKMRDYSRQNGAKFSVNSLTKRFGNWDAILKKSGLKGEKSKKGMEYGEKSIKEEVLLSDLSRVAKELNCTNLSIKEYKELGKYTAVTMRARFGSWNKAKQKAGLVIVKNRDFSDEELLKNILELWMMLGRQPKYGEVVSPNSKYHGATYARRFGSWTVALQKFIEYANSEDVNIQETANEEQAEANIVIENSNKKIEKIKTKRTPRNINLRLRWTILKRDNFSCRKCGRSPAKDPATVLHIDHITPWSKNGETVHENLETLCQDCNLGKSNLL